MENPSVESCVRSPATLSTEESQKQLYNNMLIWFCRKSGKYISDSSHVHAVLDVCVFVAVHMFFCDHAREMK